MTLNIWNTDTPHILIWISVHMRAKSISEQRRGVTCEVSDLLQESPCFIINCRQCGFIRARRVLLSFWGPLLQEMIFVDLVFLISSCFSWHHFSVVDTLENDSFLVQQEFPNSSVLFNHVSDDLPYRENLSNNYCVILVSALISEELLNFHKHMCSKASCKNNFMPFNHRIYTPPL